jgi:hypothetical protein
MQAEEKHMFPTECRPTRRNFVKGTAAIVTGFSSFALSPQTTTAQDKGDLPAAATINWRSIGPRPGFTPEIGTLTSMLAFTRMQVLHNVKAMSQQDLDFLLDGKANTIGALLLHLAATETYYGLNTFGGMKWDS